MPTYKIMVTGLSGSGKTEFIKSVSNFPLVSIQKKLVGTDEAIDMDYGRVFVGGSMIYLYAVIGDERATFLWKQFSAEMHGFILLVDSSDLEAVKQSKILYADLLTAKSLPHIVARTRIDLLPASPTVSDPDWISSLRQIACSCRCTSRIDAESVAKALHIRLRAQEAISNQRATD